MAGPSSAPLLQKLVLSCFFLSGVAGLIYQVAWAKALGIVFGSTVYAVTTVLAVFMGGLALGSDWLGRWSETWVDPIAQYGRIELGIAALGGLSLLGLAAVRILYLRVFPAIEDWMLARAALRFSASAAVLFPAAFLMGGTFPVLVGGLRDGTGRIATRVSRLYWVNTLGAVTGAVVAGFFLLPGLGLKRTVLTAVLLNALAGVIAVRLGREHPEETVSDAGRAKRSQPLAPREFLLAAFAVVGATAMAYEVSWTRLLSTMFGSSTYAFTVMLATFLAGIALGSVAFEFWARRGHGATLGSFAATQTLTAAAALVFLVSLPRFPEVISGVLRSTHPSFHGLILAQCFTSAFAMIPAAFVFGFNFPLVTALVAGSREAALGESAAVGRAYAANTFGAIAGAMMAGFWLLPQIGAFRLAALTAAVNLVLAVVLSFRSNKRLALALAINFALAAGMVFVVVSGAFYDRALATFGAELYSFMHTKALTIAEMANTLDVPFAADGPNSTVAVLRAENYLALRIDGKVDASNLDTRTQLLLGHLGPFFHGRPRRALVIGFGSGMTLAAMARYPEFERLECVEIEPAVVRAAPYFESLNQGVLRDARVHIIVDDARNYLTTTRERYDVISSEPSNPWVAGVAALYTEEFYRTAAARLHPGGLFIQWLHAYSMYPEDLKMIFSTFASQFPRTSLWRAQTSDFLLLGQIDSSPLTLDRLRDLWTRPELQSDFRELGLRHPEGLLAYHRLDDADLRRLAQGGLRNTDDRTRLEYDAPRGLYAEDIIDKNLAWVWSNRSSLLPRDVAFGDEGTALLGMTETSLALDDLERADTFLQRLEQAHPSAPSALLRGELQLKKSQFEPAKSSFQSALQMTPGNAEAQAGLGMARLESGDPSGAEASFQAALRQEPRQPRALEGMVLVQVAAQNWGEAARWQHERLSADPGPGCKEYVRLARYELRAGDLSQGEKYLAQTLDRDPYCNAAHRTLAELAINRRDWTEAKAHLESIVRYAPEQDPAVYGALAGADRALGDDAAAREALGKGLRIFPDDPNLKQLAPRQ
ncbi:MAG: fused MFS/spermidine synthase [Candidatus Acidiferrales bacterium]